MTTVSLPESEWLRTLAQRQPKAPALLAKSPEEQHRLGYFHTLREICQQPSTWMQTSDLIQRWTSALRACAKEIHSLVLTGAPAVRNMPATACDYRCNANWES